MPLPSPSQAVDLVVYGVRDLARAVADAFPECPECRRVEFAAGPVALAVVEVAAPAPGHHGRAPVALAVPDVRAAVAALHGQGVRVLSEPAESSGCPTAAISDPDGNRLFLHQRKDGTAA